MQILKMLEERDITAAEAATLLSALDVGAEKEKETTMTPGPGQKARWLRVRVTDQATGKRKVSVNVPIGLVNVAMKVGAKFVPELDEMDSQQVAEAIEAIKNGAQGKIVDVEDDEDGERVEVFVE
jgi:hypothetical protein